MEFLGYFWNTQAIIYQCFFNLHGITSNESCFQTNAEFNVKITVWWFPFFRRSVFSCLWWRNHYCLCLVLSTFYLFHLMFLSVFISKALRIFFVHVWHYGDCSWVNPVELSMTLFGVFSHVECPLITFSAVLMFFNAACQFLFFRWPVCLPLHETQQHFRIQQHSNTATIIQKHSNFNVKK